VLATLHQQQGRGPGHKRERERALAAAPDTFERETASCEGLEETDSIFQCMDEGVNFLFGVIEVKACSCTGTHTQFTMQYLCAVMP
jgi:hypothetical protein